MQIAFITDLHTSLDDKTPFGVDLKQNFLDIIEAVRHSRAEILIIGGDLCLKNGRLDVYQWQKGHLDSLGIPYHIIAGNHDNQENLCKVFSSMQACRNSEIYYDLQINGQPFLFLDTGVGSMSESQKTWLRHRISSLSKANLSVIMHHPPLLMGVPHMDTKHALSDRSEILSILRSFHGPVTVFTGHYHVEKTAVVGNVTITVTPSLFVQIDQRHEEFAIDHKRVAYRTIDLSPDGLLTAVHYLEGNELDIKM